VRPTTEVLAVDAVVPRPTPGDADNVPLADVLQLTVPSLLANGESTLSRSIQRLVNSMEDHDGVLSAFQSFIQSDE
jgi:hypothetical protein